MASTRSLDSETSSNPYSDKESSSPLLFKTKLERRTASSIRSHCSTLVLLISLLVVLLASIFSFIALEHKSRHPFSIPEPPPKEICEHATARPSWHGLPLHRRHGFVKAVQRLTTVPSRLGLNTSLYDDFTYVHIQLVWQTHHAAISLPFHRYFVHVFEQVLRKDGGYDGPIPYWDWTLDASAPLESPIWDSWAGFGGNGSAKFGGCVEDGVFGRIGKVANYSKHGYQPHCVSRVFDTGVSEGVMHSKQWSKDVVSKILDDEKTYDGFRESLENGPHRHLHWGIGGEMPTSSSTNDPIFFLHHVQIDRLWWLWQQRDPDQRHHEFFGPIQLGDESTSSPGASLDDSIKLLGLAEDVTVRDVMRTDTDLLCYKYKPDL